MPDRSGPIAGDRPTVIGSAAECEGSTHPPAGSLARVLLGGHTFRGGRGPMSTTHATEERERQPLPISLLSFVGREAVDRPGRRGQNAAGARCLPGRQPERASG
jgi:hypothetical protein